MTLGRAAVAGGGAGARGRGGRCRFAHRRKCTESTSPRRRADRGVCNASPPLLDQALEAELGVPGMLGELGDAAQLARPAQQRGQRGGAGAAGSRRRSSAAPRPRRRWRRRGRASAAHRPPAARASRAAPQTSPAATRPGRPRQAAASTPSCDQRQHVLRLAAAAGEQHLGLGHALRAPARPPRPRRGGSAEARSPGSGCGSSAAGRRARRCRARSGRRRPAPRASSGRRWRRSGSSARPGG